MSRLPGRFLSLMAIMPLVFIHDGLRQVVEGSMVLHMALQFPVLVLAGACGALAMRRTASGLSEAWRQFDKTGLLSITWLSGFAGLWMIPAALDAALIDPIMASWKYASWYVAGWCLVLVWSQMARTLRIFLLGNLAWMTFTAGLLYAETDQRLCVSYRFDEQAWTGAALCFVAVLLLFVILGTAIQLDTPPQRQH